MLKHSDAELLAAALALESRFDTPAHCTRCGDAFREEVITRRVFETGVGLALAALCTRCAQAVPPGSGADRELRAHLERRALASVSPQGRA
jgi:hypothetical protein